MAVPWKPPGAIVNGYIACSVPGGNEKQSSFGAATSDAGKDENAVIVNKNQAAEFLPLRQAVEEALAMRSGGQATLDVTDQLRKLADLRDAGIVTAEEFEAKKADLLRRL